MTTEISHATILNDAQELIKKFDELHGSIVEATKLSDEQIDEILDSEADIANLQDSLLTLYSINRNRKLTAEKIMKFAQTFINRIMIRMKITEVANQDAKAKAVPKAQYEIMDITQVPPEYTRITHNYQAINKALVSGETIHGVKHHLTTQSVTIR